VYENGKVRRFGTAKRLGQISHFWDIFVRNILQVGVGELWSKSHYRLAVPNLRETKAIQSSV